MNKTGPPHKNPSVIFQQGADQWAALVNMDNGGSLALNPTGILVWRLIDGKRDVPDIARAVKEHFGNAPDTVYEDVADLITILAQEGFVGHELPLD